MAEQAKRNVDTLEEAGFTFKTVATSASGREYEVEVPQAETWRTYYDFWKAQGQNPDDVLTKILNSDNEQGAKQGDKAQVRDAIAKGDAEQIEEAIESHQKSARTFVQGAPRGGGGARHSSGLTAKQRSKLGTRLAEVTQEKARQGKAPTQDDINAIYAELGIDPADMA